MSELEISFKDHHVSYIYNIVLFRQGFHKELGMAGFRYIALNEFYVLLQ